MRTWLEQFTYRDGAVVIRARIEIDYNRLGRLAWKATKNKGGKAKAGPVTIRAEITQGTTDEHLTP